MRGLWDTRTRTYAAPIPIPPDLVLCFTVDDEAYEYALAVAATVEDRQ